MNTKEVKKRKTYDLRLTKFELLHLRDMFGIVLPPEASKTMSQALAELEGRTLVESLLWKKISEAAEAAGLPVGDDAPDYVVALSGTPSLSVFQVTSDPSGDDSEEETDEETED